jgi:hypothetical protein
MKGRGAIQAIADQLAERREGERRQREIRGRQAAASPKAATAIPKDQLVNGFTASHGDYEEGTVVDLSGELGGGRNKIVKVMLNRGGTAVERWISSDSKGMFGEGEQRAIRYCQNLWTRAEGNLRAVDPGADRVDAPLGWAQQEALVELRRIEARVPKPYWACYENVCRFDQEAGAAGSDISSNSRSAVDAAKTTVAFTASLIAMWRRL